TWHPSCSLVVSDFDLPPIAGSRTLHADIRASATCSQTVTCEIQHKIGEKECKPHPIFCGYYAANTTATRGRQATWRIDSAVDPLPAMSRRTGTCRDEIAFAIPSSWLGDPAAVEWELVVKEDERHIRGATRWARTHLD